MKLAPFSLTLCLLLATPILAADAPVTTSGPAFEKGVEFAPASAQRISYNGLPVPAQWPPKVTISRHSQSFEEWANRRIAPRTQQRRHQKMS
jgi:hypothetical protein